MNPEPTSHQPQPAVPMPTNALMRAVQGIGVAASILVMIAAVFRAVTLYNSGWTQFAAAEHAANRSGGREAYSSAVAAVKASNIWLVVAFGVTLVAAVVFLVWLYRARVNAEAMSTEPQRLARGWTVGAWFLPLANLVLPPLLVTDIWRASTGARRASAAPVIAWWSAILLAGALNVFALVARGQAVSESRVAAYRFIATLHTGQALATVVAAGLLVLIITRITRWQQEELLQRHP